MPEQRIFVVEDDESIRKLLEHWMTKTWGYNVFTFADGEACLASLDEEPDLILTDIMMPGIGGIEMLKEVKKRDPELPVIMLSAQGDIDVAIESIKLGASDYFSKPVDFHKLEIAVKNALRLREMAKEVQSLRERMVTQMHFENIISASGEMQEVFKLVQKVKNSTICVLVMGESGTGKELISRAIHFNGNRMDGPFVVVNCASIPRDLLESELFGHEKGAFTGAYQRKIGKFERANGGTIFLDEIGELDISLQAKLLRAIQSKEFERVGGNELLKTDARVICATNKDLWEEVKQKRFREDLYYRLAAFPIVIPPLRERKSDILALAEHFLKRMGSEHGKTGLRFSRGALKALYDYPWPGNVRELENLIQRTVVMVEGKQITEHDLPQAVQTFSSTATLHSTVFEVPSTVVPLEKVREMAIRNALKLTKGNIAEASEQLQVGRATLYRLIKKYGIEV